MGQPVTVVSKPVSRQGILSFELNRSITGMGHRNYFSDQFLSTASDSTAEQDFQNADFSDQDIADWVANQLFIKFQADLKSIHLNSNVITIELNDNVAGGGNTNKTSIQTDITKFLEELFLFYSLS